jgi:hypothetical protein
LQQLGTDKVVMESSDLGQPVAGEEIPEPPQNRTPPEVHSITPTSGSICGGTVLTVYGSNLTNATNSSSNVSVQIAGLPCAIRMASDTEIICITPAFAEKVQTEHDMHIAALAVTIHGKAVPVPVQFHYDAQATPIVSTFGPVSGQGGDLVTFEGIHFGGNATIQIGDSGIDPLNPNQTKAQSCEVKQHSDLFLQCVPAPACTGLVDVHMYVEGKGNACPGPKAPIMKFLYSLTILSVRPENVDAPSMGSFGGGGSLVVVGQGFCEGDGVSLCDIGTCERTSPITADPPQFHEGDNSFQTFKCQPGPFYDPINAKLEVGINGPELGNVMFEKGPAGAPAPVSLEQMQYAKQNPCDCCPCPAVVPKARPCECESPPKEYSKSCQLTVTAAAGALKASIAGAWTYSHKMTPVITKVVHGSQGVGHLEIYGNGFKGPETPGVEAAGPDVAVGGAPCAVSTATTSKIDCYDSTTPPVGAVVTVHVPAFGKAQPVVPGADVLAR